MAQTIIGPSTAPNELAVKIWSAQTFQFALGQSFFVRRFAGKKFAKQGRGELVGTSPLLPIQVLTDLQKNQGDNIQYDVFANLKGDATYGDDQIKGKEDKLSHFSDNIRINQIRKSVDTGGRATKKRTRHDLRAIGRTRLSNWAAQYFDETITYYLAGTRGITTNQCVLPLSWNGIPDTQPFEPADEEHRVTIDSSGDLSHNQADATTFALNWLDKIKTHLSLMDVPPNPIFVGDTPFYVLVLHPKAVEQMKADTSQTGWLNLQKAAGPRGEDNPIFTDKLGQYSNFVLHSFSKVPTVTDGTHVYALNLILGAQAATVAFGNAGGSFTFDWNEEMDDRGNRLVITGGQIYGTKKVRFNGQDFGCIVMPTLIS